MSRNIFLGSVLLDRAILVPIRLIHSRDTPTPALAGTALHSGTLPGMGIPAGVSRWVLRGHLTGGEIFETGYWTQNAFTTPTDANAGCATAAANAVTDLAGPLFGKITADCGYDEVRVYSYPSGGPSATIIGSATITGGTGGGTSPVLPLQTAVCVTLRTALAGRAHRGRMYFPMNVGTLTAHQMSSADTTAIANGVATFLGRYSAALGPVVVSQIGAGAKTPITTVTVDSKPDVQRRRAARLVAANTGTKVITFTG